MLRPLRYVVLPIALTACFPAKAPLKTSFHEGEPDSRTLMIMLPGFGARDTTFDKRGVIAAARDAGLRADILAADLTYGYYISEKWEDRMREDVFDVYADRYDHIWVLGISMGGMGALLTSKVFYDQVDGTILLSPFLGRRKTLRALQREGLDAWRAPEDAPLWDESLWTWMQGWSSRGWQDPPLFLGHGDRDLGMRNLEWMASLLPPDRVEVVSGGHTWPVWGELTTVMVRDQLTDRFVGFGAPAPDADADTDEAVADPGSAAGSGGTAAPTASPSDD